MRVGLSFGLFESAASFGDENDSLLNSNLILFTGKFVPLYIRHCEEGALPDEAISYIVLGIASGKEQDRPRNDK